MSHFLNVNVVSLDVTNWEAAKQFYRAVLGWPVAYSNDEIGWEEYGAEGQAHVSINRVDKVPAGRGGTVLVLGVEDAHAVTADLRARGVRCIDVVTIPGVVTYGGFFDPEGNHIQMVSIAPPPA